MMPFYDPHPTLERALEYQRAGDLNQAERLCQQVLQTRPEQAKALYLLGVIGLDELWAGLERERKRAQKTKKRA